MANHRVMITTAQIDRALTASDGFIQPAAKLLKCSRMTVLRWLKDDARLNELRERLRNGRARR